jgi:hypothetical protein
VNLIASLSAQGKRVLFVAEKRAALDVVLRRLENVGLGHLALDLHGAELSASRSWPRRRRLVKVRESVPGRRPHPRPVRGAAQAAERAVARMHAPLPPSARSVYQLEGELLRLRDLQTAIRWRSAELARIDAPAEGRVLDLLVEAGGFGALALRSDPGPWNGARLATGDDAQAAIDHATALAGGEWLVWREALSGLAAATGLPQPATLADAQTVISLASRASEVGQAYERGPVHPGPGALRSGLRRSTWGGSPPSSLGSSTGATGAR